MLNPYYFTDRALQVCFNISLHSNHVNHANSKIIIKPNFLDFGIEFRYIIKIMRGLSVIYARIINQYKFKYQTVFSARNDKQDEDIQVLEETELFNTFNIIHNLTETDIKKIDVQSQLEHQIQVQETKGSGWRFDRINSMTIYFHKTGEMNGRSYVKIPLRSAAILNFENDDKYCFIWSISAKLRLCNNIHSNRVSKFRQNYNELNIEFFDFTNGFKCGDVHRYNELNRVSINVFELIFYQNGDKWKHKLIPIEISINKSNKFIDLKSAKIIMLSLKNYMFF